MWYDVVIGDFVNIFNEYINNMNGILIEMANLSPKRTGLKVRIWAESRGVERNKPDNSPRVILQLGDKSMSISIEPKPKILAKSRNIKKSDLSSFNDAILYIGRNSDLFLKHYNDTSDEFDDEDLFLALRERGEYKI